ncbi:CHAP domain-containing protein [Nonomuraea ferruginea]|uniref:CHAP domain-containing protein n=1 Tax=Nonomuraea ferruginea TaxID=46174 RepID=A0ABT4SVA6_9ACTN|nr:CHAP domain-containing protein [Nonomuraea ferruginea]MDA0640990.1 CHAP domain-containing protein [Nonomuraea ferruginea]
MRKFIELLESQLGYSEKSGAYTKFGNWYGENIEFDADYSSAPWCDMFLGWAATKLGYEEWMGQFAWTVAHAKWFRKQDAWGTKPEPGAFVFFDWGGSDSIARIDHVGVVTKVAGGRIHTIEGNIDGGVAKRKVRDTGKVVGYGYPWKIKERLDAEAAQKAADEAAAMEAKAGVGTQDGSGLAIVVPHVELDGQQKVPSATRPEKEQKKKDATPPKAGKSDTGKKSEPAPKAVPGAADSPAPKSGKHAKPTTADTSAVTTGPLPVITDASATSPSVTVDSPALLTSALVAALAVLAVAKAKTLRLRPAPAGAAVAQDSASRSHRRRKSRKQARTASSRPLQEPMELEAPRPLVDVAEPVTALRSLRALFPHEPIVIPEATSEFDAFSRPRRPAPAPERPITLVWEDDGSTRRLITDTGPIEIPREPGLYELPDPYSAFHLLGGASGPFPIREEPVLPLASANRGEPVLPLAAPDRGEPVLPLASADAHPGRRRRDHPAAPSRVRPEERPTADTPLRGRRHRQSVDIQRLEPFVPDAPLRGRRHRPHDPAHGTQHARTHAASQNAPYEPAGPISTRTYEPALTGTPRSADRAPAARDIRGTAEGRRGPRRGRHRA